MGQLRNGIVALQKTCLNMDPQIGAMEKQQEDFANRVFDAAKRIVEGNNALVLCLTAKLTKAGKTFESEGEKTLKEEMDGSVVTLGNGIAQAKADVKAIIARLKGEQEAAVGPLQASVAESEATMGKLKSIAEKKKAKWLKSAKYKSKIAGYLGALAAIDEILKKQGESLTGIESIQQSDAWVERNFPFNQDMKLKDVRGLASMDLNSNLKDFETNKAAISGRTRVFRDEYKSLASQFAMMKKWVDEADEMEAES